MKKLACILLTAVSVSGCSILGRAYVQYPTDRGGWTIGSVIVNSANDREKTAEFSCGGYKYRLSGGFTISDSHWFGPPFLPIFPPFFAGAGNPKEKDIGEEFDLDVDGKLPEKFVCPVIKMYGKAYKTPFDPIPSVYHEGVVCRYDTPTPKETLTMFIEDQMGCKVPPLEYKLTPEWYYIPLYPGTGYGRTPPD